MDRDPEARRKSMRLLAGIMLAVGWLTALLSGGCSLLWLVNALGSADLAFIALLFGGIPFALGILLILGGNALFQVTERDEKL